MKLSLVIAAYNVENYLDECLTSIFGQTVLPQNFEVIIVNDGSKDGTAGVIARWEAAHPNHVKSIHQNNAGVAAARNAGLKVARGEWVSFPDADDFFHKNCFAHMLAEATAPQSQPRLAIVMNLVFFHEVGRRFVDNHPLRRRFSQGVVRRNSTELGDHIQLATNSVWMDRLSVLRHQITFNSLVSPTFEDAHFVNRLFLLEPEKTVSFVPKAIYCYRKRASQDSAMDSAAKKTGWYSDEIEFGTLSLIDIALRCRGSVPQFIKNVLYYHAFWRIRQIAENPALLDILSSDQKLKFETLIHLVFHHLDPKTILSFDFPGLTEPHKVALLGKFFDVERSQPRIYLNQFDQQAGMAQFIFYSHDEKSGSPQTFANGKPVQHLYPKMRRKDFLGRSYYTEKSFWIPLKSASVSASQRVFTFEFNGSACNIRRGSAEIGKSLTTESIRQIFKHSPQQRFPEKFSKVREHIIKSRTRYRDAYVFIDRPAKADDNAEHLYRYVAKLKKGHQIWFVLQRSSPDWNRLEREGFRLLEYGTSEHLAAHFNARFVLSSEATEDILWPAEREACRDLARYQFAFLQHGVTTNDLSRWLNPKPIRMFVAASEREFRSITDSEGSYVFTSKEVVLSGFPRHDELLRASMAAAPRTLAILPTWRKVFTQPAAPEGLKTRFLDEWFKLLHDPRLKSMAEGHGLKIKFAPHRLMAEHMRDLKLPSHVEFIDVTDNFRYQHLISESALALSDYSSVLTEFAYIRRPVVYFQFDRDEFLGGGHTLSRGYFDYDEDGFGAVGHTTTEVFAHMNAILQGREDPEYAARRESFFAFRDGRCCERVWQEVLKRSSSEAWLSSLARPAMAS
jgi:glycosyltransferase involved in cell wall biosynthesis